MTIRTCILSLCKIANIPTPSRDELKMFANVIFTTIDTDYSKSIDFEEFRKYVSNSEELNDFLMKYFLNKLLLGKHQLLVQSIR